MGLLFWGIRDGMNSRNFHEKYDNKGPTITLLRNDKGNIMGGFSLISWTCEEGYPPSKILASKNFLYIIFYRKFLKKELLLISK